MTNATFALPSSIEIASRGRTVLLDPASLPQEVLAQALEHGLRQKIADSAASALLDAFAAAHDEETVKASTAESRKVWGNDHPEAVADAAQSAMEAAMANLREHGWTVRATSGAVQMSPLEEIACKLVKEDIKAKKGKLWKAHQELSTAKEKTEYLLQITRRNWKVLEPLAIKERDKEALDLDI